VDGQYDKLVMVVGHQFITMAVYICVQHGGREAPRRSCLSAAAYRLVTYLELGASVPVGILGDELSPSGMVTLLASS